MLLFFKRVYAEQPLKIKLVNSVPTIVTVIAPLNALMHDQIRRLTNNSSGDICITASVINIKHGDDEDEDPVALNCNLDDSCFEKNELENGRYNILFSHPEALVSCKYGRNLMLNKIYQDNVCTVVVRVQLLKCLDASNPKSLSPLHDCCSECVLSCQCHECKEQN